MQESGRYAVGLDIGTTTVRCAVGLVEPSNPTPNVIAIGVAPGAGMRKGMVNNIVSVAQAIDAALEASERMSGYEIHSATVSVNGSHVVAMNSKGMVTVGVQNHEINEQDLRRAEDAAAIVQLPPNREILQVSPRSYRLDGQENIKDPIGMSGVRLEVDAHVITALSPHIKNLQKAMEMTHTQVNHMVMPALAASHTVLSEKLVENGVALIDIGGATTNVAVFEEGELQHVAILPLGGMNITNDLAIGLKTDLDIAEKLKLQLHEDGKSKMTTIKYQKEQHSFDTEEIEEIIEARLDEIFEMVDKELKRINRSGKLPGGIVLVGGSAHLKGIVEQAKASLNLPARIGIPQNISGLVDKVSTPEFATAVGLMLEDLQGPQNALKGPGGGFNFSLTSDRANKLFKNVKGVLGKFKS
ncbi:MAG TPA: cell division protein FtsA [Candidatus Saccharimonadales bacterium]|nr:cell division protein FtsA [Candidatus Saccharimonadales bacterium]